MTEKDFVFKLVLLGEAAVGKTSIVYRFVRNMFKENLASTLGVNISKKTFYLDEEKEQVRVLLWDLGGDQKFVNMRKTFIMGARGALLIFDLTRRNTLEALDKWRLNFIEIMGEQPMLLIGNKSDLTDHITISNEEAQNYAQKNNLQLIITSAKTGENVEAAFKELVKDIIQIYNQ